MGGQGHGTRAAVEGTFTAAATAASAQGRRYEEVRVRLVRRAARARQTIAGVPDEHAQPQATRGSSGTSEPPAKRHRSNTRGTLTDRCCGLWCTHDIVYREGHASLLQNRFTKTKIQDRLGPFTSVQS